MQRAPVLAAFGRRIRIKRREPMIIQNAIAAADKLGTKRKIARKLFGLTDPQKDVKVVSANGKDELRDSATGRFAEASVFSRGFTANPNNWDMTSQGASEKWKNAVIASTAEVIAAYGMSGQRLEERKQLYNQGYREKGSSGYFSPFIVANGVLRGGYTGHAKSTTVNGRACAAIPVDVGGRKLTNMRAAYRHPLAYPETRQIKFTYGTWGSKQGAVHEQI